MKVDLSNNITLVWDGAKIGLEVPEAYEAKFPEYTLFGLMGAYNNDTKDDFTGPDGNIKDSAEDFGKSWEVPGSCDAVQKRSNKLGKSFFKQKKYDCIS